MNITESVVKEKQGTSLGRACCGKRCTQGKVDDQWQSVKLVNTEFKDWNCMVDWYFLHIDQTLQQVFHHQTCQALRGNKRGALGYLSDSEILLSELSRLLEQTSVPPIICPNQRCGCGMCVPKARDYPDFKVMWEDLTNVPIQEIHP